MFARSGTATKADFSACSGCGLCLLVCPVWRKTRDLRYTPHGRAKALQHGVPVAELAPSIESCTLCGACEPACPEIIDLVGMVLDLRRQLPPLAPVPVQTRRATRAADYAGHSVLLADKALRENDAAHRRTALLLGCAMADDDGDDIALLLEAGAAISANRLEEFLAPLRSATAMVIGDGLLARALGNWLPRMNITGAGFALSRRADVRRRLRIGDLYVIEPRAYHADHARLLRHYDKLRRETGCTLNLDLQHFAIPATARTLRQRLGLEAPDDAGQARWILQGRKIRRIIVESLEDITAFRQVCDLPVVYLADLTDDGAMKTGTRF
jgi:ferredoxin